MGTKKRAYNVQGRTSQAQANKERILTCAKELFESHGFEKITIEKIAKSAQVSAPTVYALFKSKIGILKAIIDNALPAEEHAALVERGKLEKSPAKRIATAATISRQLYDAERKQLGAFQDISILDPVFKKQEIERENRRYDRLKEPITNLAKEKALAPGLSLEKAHDIFWAFTGRDLYRMLVVERGWSSQQYEEWLAELLVKTLLK
ncbi:TetR/AcrR family transcriptional regulator [soil metagenome]